MVSSSKIRRDAPHMYFKDREARESSPSLKSELKTQKFYANIRHSTAAGSTCLWRKKMLLRGRGSSGMINTQTDCTPGNADFALALFSIPL